jgi:hypothetical protein
LGFNRPASRVTRPLFSTHVLALSGPILFVFWWLLVFSANAQAQWSWQVINYGGDLWISNFYNGAYQFQYRIGTGGSIQEIRDANGDLLAPPGPRFDGPGTNHTDRVIQGCA